jgi:uncharacterized protein YndB with AHSA1/START domain
MAESAARSGSGTVLQLVREFAAPREAVFRAFTDPQELMQWFGPADEFAVPIAEVDLRVGGAYVIEIRDPSGKVLRVGGIYREIVSPARLVFTWQWEGNPRETLVTIELAEIAGRTELRLTHERFVDAGERDAHGTGWSGSFDRLSRHLG